VVTDAPPAEPAPDLETPVARPLLETAELVGAYRWLEHRLFELTGGWALEPSTPAVQVHLSEVSLQHAWHAELWEDRLPVLASVDPAALTRPPPGAEAALAVLEAAPDAVTRLGGLYRALLPRLLAAYDRHAATAAPVADGPVVRALTLVRRDEIDQRRAGEALLEGLWAGTDDLDRALDTARRLESALLNGGSALFLPEN
jgi:hypothetical protein